eukprot:1145356-Alexandrium_andersonii.AAC.1
MPVDTSRAAEFLARRASARLLWCSVLLGRSRTSPRIGRIPPIMMRIAVSPQMSLEFSVRSLLSSGALCVLN